ncbi:hypothetical protein LTR64_001767 [Lithohypha guttulata]|uniref:uncharacterized protein n=1 Tax=Lithohypha guttulata TaxID=1690604 RepID=UPI002DE1C3F1|nr:hypothetical protein LTR51_003961 [Lithohypha guttulata]
MADRKTSTTDSHSSPTIELMRLDDKHIHESKSPQNTHAKTQHELQTPINNDDLESTSTSTTSTTSPPPSSDPTALQHWNKPRGNIARFAASFYAMFVFGLSDAAYGALLPYLEQYYNLSYTVVSLIFLCPFAGYAIAAFTNSWFHHKFGQRGIALVAPGCHVVAYIVLSLHLPWPVVVSFTCLAGFGNGLIDAAWSSWAGHMEAGNILEGSLHAFYALGCTFSPLIATSLVVRRGVPWYYFYYMLTGLSFVALITSTSTFWSKTGAVYVREHPRVPGQSSTKLALKNRVTWLCCAFFLIYVGAEVALGGWIVSFMLHVRRATPYASGIIGTGFWAGMTVGRSLLGVVTHSLITYTNQPHKSGLFHRLRLTERSVVTVYIVCAIGLELLFWLVPSITASAVAVAFLGMFLGPIFPSGIIMATKLLSNHLHIPSVGFSTALGGTGGAIFPFAVGAIAQEKGVQVLQPVVLSMLVVLLLVWLCFPRLKVHDRAE